MTTVPRRQTPRYLVESRENDRFTARPRPPGPRLCFETPSSGIEGMHRRDILSGLLSLSLAGLLAPERPRAAPNGIRHGEGRPFDPGEVYELARRLSEQAYEPAQESVPAVLRDLTYDQWRDIRFRPDQALWRGQGIVPRSSSSISATSTARRCTSTRSRTAWRARCSTARICSTTARTSSTSRLPEHLGFAGFRLHEPLNRPDYLDEVVVFLGASYFRALGREQRYGLSARGLAIDTGAADAARSSPSFTRVLAGAAGAAAGSSSSLLRAARQPEPDRRLSASSSAPGTHDDDRRATPRCFRARRSRSSASRR